jgi:hypothetical protein
MKANANKKAEEFVKPAIILKVLKKKSIWQLLGWY